MGSGGLLVMDDATCMVNVAQYFLSFASAESYGSVDLPNWYPENVGNFE